jgi:hypothetical protein
MFVKVIENLQWDEKHAVQMSQNLIFPFFGRHAVFFLMRISEGHRSYNDCGCGRTEFRAINTQSSNYLQVPDSS